jgi:hypothetical protein
MLVSFAEHIVEFHLWASKDDLLNHVKKCDGGMLILGTDAAQEAAFYSAVVHFNYAARCQSKLLKTLPRSWGIALISEGHGLKPHTLILDNKTLVFGLNQKVVGIIADARQILFHLSFDSLFRAFIHLEEFKILLVLNEIGVIAITEAGSELWRYEKDIMTDCLIEERVLLIEFMDSPSVRLNLLDGSLR